MDVCIAVFTGFVVCSGFFVAPTASLQEGQVLAGEFCLGYNMIHRYKDLTLPISNSTSLMCIMTL